MKRLKLVCACIVLAAAATVVAEPARQSIWLPTGDSTRAVRDYSFTVFDGTASKYTMKQFNQNYLSAYRLSMRGLDDALGVPFGQTTVSTVIKILLPFFTVPLTHEEAHRSILTALDIGSVSHPFVKYSRECYVTGVSDATLKNLRDTDLPAFIRLHTAGIESDYMLCAHSKELLAFGGDAAQNVGFDLFMRDVMNIVYLSEGLYYPALNAMGFSKVSVTDPEESDELKRDIVGDDVCGMVFHLFRPDAPYSRYKTYADLSSPERAFASRIGWRSLLNLANSSYIAGHPFSVSDRMSVSGNMGYCLAPFGDFIDEQVYVRYDRYNVGLYAREYENRRNWFPAFGASLVDFRPVDRLSLTVRGHFWMQPENLDFNAATAVPGGAVEFSATGFVPGRNGSPVKAVGLTFGGMVKTAGFLPETETHRKGFSLSMGIAFRS